VATAAAAVVPRAKGSVLSAGGEIPALTAVRDEAGAVSRRLKEMKEALELDFSFLPASLGLWSYVCLVGG
jgi:hypothetical protein